LWQRFIDKKMLQEYKILRQHGIQFVPDLKGAILTELFRGRPEISADITKEEIKLVSELCPAKAFETEPFGLNMGKCIFCKECHFACPSKIKFTNDYKIATNDPEQLVVKPGATAPVIFNESLVRKEIRKLFKNSLKLRQVSAAGDNCNEMELNASGNVNFDMGRYGIEFVASPRHADGVVITGPISKNMAKALEITYKAIPAPRIVVLVGSDAISGGLFINGGVLNREFLIKYPVDLYVPGNPAHPLTFINGIFQLIGK